MTGLVRHTLPELLPSLKILAANYNRVADVGPGIRPAVWIEAAHHICIEPSPVYAAILRHHGFDTIEKRAVPGLRDCGQLDLVLMLDVIEHMDREEGEIAIRRALEKAGRVLVYTPKGFVEQTTDAWGLGEHDLQTHRSGWTPADFPGWNILECEEGFAAIST